MWRHLTETISGSMRCRNLYQINTRKSRTIDMRPVDVILAIAKKLLGTVYSNVKIAGTAKFKINDSVCVSKYKTNVCRYAVWTTHPCSIHRWRWVCSEYVCNDGLCWNANMDASRSAYHRSSYPRIICAFAENFFSPERAISQRTDVGATFFSFFIGFLFHDTHNIGNKENFFLNDVTQLTHFMHTQFNL